MREYKRFILFICLIIFIFFGCKSESQHIGIKKESVSYDEKVFTVVSPPEIEICSDTSDIEIFNWDEDSVKFEMVKRVKRVNNSEEQLKEEYKNFEIITEQKESKIYFRNLYKGDRRKPLDQSLDLKIYIPRKVKSIKIQLDLGKVKIHDDINCSVIADLNMANIEIKKLEGLINVRGDMSNIKVSSGILYNGSIINVNMGNIDLKFDYQEGGEYEFITKTGNIDLYMPETSQISLDSAGYIQKNEVKCGDFPTKIKVKTQMGRICINKQS